jgi:FkbM family methyltransferase
MLEELLYFKTRIKFLLKQRAFKKNYLLVTLRLLILTILILFKKKLICTGNFNKKKFKFILDPSRAKRGGRGYFLYREKQELFLEFGQKLINENDTIIDCGANQGIFSLSMRCKVGINGKIFSIEPFNECISIFNENIKINNFKNIYLLKNIISDKVKYRYIDYSDGISSASIINNYGNKIKKIKSITLDYLVYIKKIKKIDFIKIDTEGAELMVIKGGLKTIKKFKPIIYLECSTKKLFLNIKNQLKKMKHKFYVFDDQGSLIEYKIFNPNYRDLIIKFQ